MKRLVLLSSLVLIGFSSAVWSQANQQPAPAAAPAPQPNPENFVGKVTGHPTTEIRMLRYSFEPGARTNWHSHEGGQVILIEKGHARVQEAGGAMRGWSCESIFRSRNRLGCELGQAGKRGRLPPRARGLLRGDGRGQRLQLAG